MTIRLGIALAGDKPLADYAALAAGVDAYGFDTLSVYDDLMFKPAWPILVVAAQQTRRVRLGPAVTNPYLTHPALLAGQLALLDEISGGRAFLGIGRGAFMDFLQVETPQPVQAIREAVEMVRRLLRGDRTPYHGRLFRATPAAFLRWTPPRRDVPIMVGAWGPRMCEMAGEVADEVKVSPTWNAAYARTLHDRIAAGAQRAGREASQVTLVLGVLTSVAEDREAARAFARRSLAIYLPYLSPMTEIVGVEEEELRRVREASVRGDYAEAARYVSDRSLDSFTLCGTPSDLIEAIERMAAEAPVGRIEFGTPHGPDEAEAIRLLGERVLPAVHGGGQMALPLDELTSAT